MTTGFFAYRATKSLAYALHPNQPVRGLNSQTFPSYIYHLSVATDHTGYSLTRQVKMNPNFSPADSLLSMPSETYNSLFDNEESASPAATAMTPRSLDDTEREDSKTPQPSSEASDKKPVKKRKSWGQELPTPKTNLPPRYVMSPDSGQT